MKEKSIGKYLSLYEETRDDIINGVYKKGSKLPSKRVMAEKKNVSVITISHAYELLAEEGYIVPKEKSGYYVDYDDEKILGRPEHKNATKVKRKHYENIAPDERAFSFSIYAKTVRKVLSEYAEEIAERSPGFGTEILREAIAGYLARSRRIHALADQIIIGSGAEYLYELIVETLGRDLIYNIESPSYKKIAQVYSANGANLSYLELGEDGIKTEELLRAKGDVLHISPFRSFPSGVMASAMKKREYLHWSEDNNGIIIEDDFESEFSVSKKPEESVFSLDKSDHVIYLNTFSQTIGSFIRTSYMVVPRRLIPLFDEKVGFHACPVPTPEQYVIAELIQNGDFERHINRVRRMTRRSIRG